MFKNSLISRGLGKYIKYFKNSLISRGLSKYIKYILK